MNMQQKMAGILRVILHLIGRIAAEAIVLSWFANKNCASVLSLGYLRFLLIAGHAHAVAFTVEFDLVHV
jgi:hypothetical protein